MKKKTKSFVSKIISSIQEHPIKLLIAILAYILINAFLGFEAALFLGTLVLFALLRWSSKIFIGIGLLFLISCLLYLTQRKIMLAEQMANYAYYSLFLGIILHLFEYLRGNDPRKNFFRKIYQKIQCLKK